MMYKYLIPFLALTCAAEPLAVWVSILPQKSVVEAVGGDAVELEVLIEPGRSPATYTPSARQMSRLAKADLFFSIGVPAEVALAAKIERSMPGLRVVNMGGADGAHVCHPGHDHAHHHHDGEHLDPHTWMAPLELVAQAERVRDALMEVAPEQATTFRDNAARYIARLQSLHEELLVRFEPYRGRTFYINHPSLGVFAKAYGLEQRSVEIEGRAPRAKHLQELIAGARAAGVKCLYAQPQFARSGMDVLAEALDVPVVTIDPLAEDCVQNIRAVADALIVGFE